MAFSTALPRIILLGGRGLLGSSLLPALRTAFGAVRNIDRTELNLTNLAQVETALRRADFDIIVNAAGYTAVDDCEVNERLAYLVNADAPARIAEIAAARGALMIYFSTDYVFDGEATVPYDEDDPPNPLSIYGQSKLAGESAVLGASNRHLVIRLSWLFGPGRPAFPGWVLHKAATDGSVRIVRDKFACPTFSSDLAGWLNALLKKDTVPGGILHLCNSGVCSWNEWGQYVIDCAVSTGLLPKSVSVEPIKLADLSSLTARRPLYSPLATEKFSSLTGLTPRPWQEAVAEHVSSLR